MAHTTISSLIEAIQAIKKPVKLMDNQDQMDLVLTDQEQEIEYALTKFEKIQKESIKYEKWDLEMKRFYNMWCARLNMFPLVHELYSNARIDRQPAVLNHIKECHQKLKQNGWINQNNQNYQELLLIRNHNFGPSIEDMIGEYDWIFETDLPHFRLLIVLNDKKGASQPNPEVFIPGAWELFWCPIDVDDQFWDDETGFILPDYLTFIEESQSDDIWEMDTSMLMVAALGDLKVRRSEMNPLIVNAGKIVLMKSIVQYEYQLRFCEDVNEDANIYRNLTNAEELTDYLNARSFVGTDGLIALIRHIPDEKRTIILPTNLYCQELIDQMNPKFINNYYVCIDRRFFAL